MGFDFDLLAKQYTQSIKVLPESYVNFITKTFKLHSKSKIIDLGCGSGLLTFPLSKVSSYVSGLDISHNMISIAKSKDMSENIRWIESDVETFDFGTSYYDLIISYEAIHLFPHIHQLLQKCSNALKSGGILCMGWCLYNWELLLEKEIVSTFSKYGVEWGEWSYQKFFRFKELINSNIIKGLSLTKSECIDIYEEWSVIDIVEYITSISKALSLTINQNVLVKKELWDIITSKYGESIKGSTQFWIRYAQKR